MVAYQKWTYRPLVMQMYAFSIINMNLLGVWRIPDLYSSCLQKEPIYIPISLDFPLNGCIIVDMSGSFTRFKDLVLINIVKIIAITRYGLPCTLGVKSPRIIGTASLLHLDKGSSLFWSKTGAQPYNYFWYNLFE